MRRSTVLGLSPLLVFPAIKFQNIDPQGIGGHFPRQEVRAEQPVEEGLAGEGEHPGSQHGGSSVRD
jgi:hypothetical protein